MRFSFGPHHRWRFVTTGVLLTLPTSYNLYVSQEFSHGGSLTGILYGTLAFVLLILLMTYGVRKRMYTSRFGLLFHWRNVHLDLGVLSLFMTILHSGFRFHDTIAVTSFLVLVAVVVSGVVGVYFARVVPPRFVTVDSHFTVSDLVTRCAQLEDSIDRIATGKSSELRAIAEAILTDNAGDRRHRFVRALLVMVTRFTLRSEASPLKYDALAAALNLHAPNVDACENEELQRLCVLAGQLRKYRAQLTVRLHFKRLLEAWLYIHLPLSFGLLLLVAAHVLGALYYSQIGAILWILF